jgi:hypothetical protein
MYSDWIELLNLFIAHKVRFMLVGGVDSEPRHTIQVCVATDKENAERVYAVLREFGAPLTGISKEDFSTPGITYQMGRPPLRVDVLTTLSGIEFEATWSRRTKVNYFGVEIPMISIEDLIANKLASGRERDLKDVEEIKRFQLKQ